MLPPLVGLCNVSPRTAHAEKEGPVPVSGGSPWLGLQIHPWMARETYTVERTRLCPPGISRVHLTTELSRFLHGELSERCCSNQPLNNCVYSQSVCEE